MILGEIKDWDQYQHIETGRIVEVKYANVQMKHGNVGPFLMETDRTPWTSAVAYFTKDLDDSAGRPNIFVTDIDSFRRKFKQIEKEHQDADA